MEKIDIILWVIGAGFTLNFTLLLIVWNSLNARMDKLDQRMDRIENRLDKLDEKITDIDRRLCRLEGAFSSKECCMLSHDSNRKNTG